MKIAIFGDSFADEADEHLFSEQRFDSWPEVLRKKYYPDLTCYAVSGSSLYYSYELFKKNHLQYDKIIFIVTVAGRSSLPNYITKPPHLSDRIWLRLKSFANINSVEHILKTANDFSLNQETIKAFEAARMYFEYLHDQQKEDVIHNLLRQDIIKIKPDTLILDISPSMTNLARFEIESVGLDWNYMNQNFQDHRRCHLTKRNNEILAEKMHQWIDTGIAISLEVKDFEVPSREEIELLFGMDKK